MSASLAPEFANCSRVESVLRDALGVKLTLTVDGRLNKTILPFSFPLNNSPVGGGREWRQFSFIEAGGERSEVGFALERSPDLYPPHARALAFSDWGDLDPDWRYVPHAVAVASYAPWKTANGVQELYARDSLARFQKGDRPFDPE